MNNIYIFWNVERFSDKNLTSLYKTYRKRNIRKTENANIKEIISVNRDRGALWELAGLFGTDRAFWDWYGCQRPQRKVRGMPANAAKLSGYRETADTFLKFCPNICTSQTLYFDAKQYTAYSA